ncbi:MAG: hypothetical protein ACOZAN_04900 [Patescibacteria group bacterium]
MSEQTPVTLETVVEEVVYELIREKDLAGKVVQVLANTLRNDQDTKIILESLRRQEGKTNIKALFRYFVDVALKVYGAADFVKIQAIAGHITEDQKNARLGFDQLLTGVLNRDTENVGTNNVAEEYAVHISPSAQAINVEQLAQSGAPIEQGTDLSALMAASNPETKRTENLYTAPVLTSDGVLHGVPTTSPHFQMDLQNCKAAIESGAGDINALLRVSHELTRKMTLLVLQEIANAARRGERIPGNYEAGKIKIDQK